MKQLTIKEWSAVNGGAGSDPAPTLPKPQQDPTAPAAGWGWMEYTGVGLLAAVCVAGTYYAYTCYSSPSEA